MSPLSSAFLAAVLAVPAVASSPGAPADSAAFLRALETAKTQARAHFLAHAVGSPYADTAVRLPEAATDEGTAKREELKVLLEQARDIQEGCALPCTSQSEQQVYAGKMDLVGQRLGVPAGELPKIRARYIPEGRPRLKRAGLNGGSGIGGTNPSAQALDAEVTAILLQTQQLAPQVRADLQRKALAMADALGKTPQLTADSNGVVTFGDGTKRMLTPQQLAELNRLPQAQASYLRRLGTMKAPPSPGDRQAQILAEADRAVEENGGFIGDTYKYWDREAKDPNSGWLWRNYSRLNKGLLTFSGLKAVEESAGRLGYVWDNPEVSGAQKFWMGTKLAGNMALSAVSFLPAASFAKSVGTGLRTGVAAAEGGGLLTRTVAGAKGVAGEFYWIGRGGSAVPGMTRAGAETAQTMTATSGQLAKTVTQTIPATGEVGVTQLRSMFQGVNTIGQRYGVTIVEGGVVGESTAQGGKILVSLGAGAKHESIHVVQQAYTRILAVEQAAAKYGTTVEGLTQAQRAEAFANAARWEAASYAQLESQAFRGTGFMGMGGGSGYTQQLLLTGQEVTQGMKNGAVLDGSFGVGARFYGRLTQILGHSQYQIGTGLAAPLAMGTRSEFITSNYGPMLDNAVSPLTTPTEPSVQGAAGNAYGLLKNTAGPTGMFLPGGTVTGVRR